MRETVKEFLQVCTTSKKHKEMYSNFSAFLF